MYFLILGITIMVFLFKFRRNGISIADPFRISMPGENCLAHVLVAFFLIVIIGFRGIEVGNDTIIYYYRFTQLLEGLQENVQRLFYINGIEFGYHLFQKLFISASGSFALFLTFSAFLIIIPVIFVIHRYSKIPLFSYLIFLTYGFFLLSMSGIRQSAALGFCFLAYHFVVRRRPWLFLTCIAVAFSFHMTSIVFLPFYWLSKIKYSRYYSAVFLILALFVNSVLVLRMDSILQWSSNFSRNVYVETETSSFLKVFVFFVFSVLVCVLLAGKYFNNDFVLKSSWQSFSIYVIPLYVAAKSPVLERLLLYYELPLIVLLPNVAACIENKIMRRGFIFLFVFVGFYLYYRWLLGYGLHYYPYMFFWE